MFMDKTSSDSSHILQPGDRETNIRVEGEIKLDTEVSPGDPQSSNSRLVSESLMIRERGFRQGEGTTETVHASKRSSR